MIRAYHSKDKPILLELIQLNTPAYFSESEWADFSNYLDHERADYFVILAEQQIVGCGGINYEEEGTLGILSWDMIHPNLHGKGLGRSLVEHRLQLLRSQPPIIKVKVRTSQFTNQFYAKFGFELQKVVKDYWAPGYDLYDMDLVVSR